MRGHTKFNGVALLFILYTYLLYTLGMTSFANHLQGGDILVTDSHRLFLPLSICNKSTST